MTEQEWRESADLFKMGIFLEGKVSERKLRLFAFACCDRIKHLMEDPRCRRAVDALGEYISDGCSDKRYLKFITEVGEGVLDALLEHSNGVVNEYVQYLHVGPEEPTRMPETVACYTAHAVRHTLSDARYHSLTATAGSAAHAVALATGSPESEDNEAQAQRGLLRCVVGTLPFRPVTIDPTLLTSTVKRLAEVIYEGSRFDRLPFLGDALEDAGCNNQDILDHCRQPGVHVKGCWCLDLILGKE